MSPGLTFLVSALQDQGSAWLDELIGIQVEFHHRSCKVGAGSQQALPLQFLPWAISIRRSHLPEVLSTSSSSSLPNHHCFGQPWLDSTHTKLSWNSSLNKTREKNTSWDCRGVSANWWVCTRKKCAQTPQTGQPDNEMMKILQAAKQTRSWRYASQIRNQNTANLSNS